MNAQRQMIIDDGNWTLYEEDHETGDMYTLHHNETSAQWLFEDVDMRHDEGFNLWSDTITIGIVENPDAGLSDELVRYLRVIAKKARRVNTDL